LNPIYKFKEQIKVAIQNAAQASYSSLQQKNYIKKQWVISHVLEGDVHMTTGSKNYLVQPGDVMIHPPDILFSESNTSKGLHQVIFLYKLNQYISSQMGRISKHSTSNK
jgi:mannose-6-phosphate isomerase-like protein (cupin superfamily)